jgi:hypothetical protein
MKLQEIESRFGTVLLEFPICRSDWEMDGKGWIIKAPEGTQLILTNHGQPYVAQVSELQEIEQEYNKYLQALLEAKQLLNP